MELPFAGLHQLCAPVLGWLGALPDPQRHALSIAFGLSSGDAPDRFLVALAALSLLAEAAEERPLLCLVDDAQWLDRASAQVLGFLARRLLAEPVAVVFAVREPGNDHELTGLPELPLAGLEEDDARALISDAIPGLLDERVRDRIIAETARQPAGAVGAAARNEHGGAGRRLRPSRTRAIFRGRSRTTTCGGLARCPNHAAIDAAGGGRPGWRRDPALARRAMRSASKGQAATPAASGRTCWRSARASGFGIRS